MVRASVDMGPMLSCCLVNGEALLVLQEQRYSNHSENLKHLKVRIEILCESVLTCLATTAS